MSNNKIKVVWLCQFSNAFVHGKLDLKYNRLIGLVKCMAHKPVSTDVPEYANWITNGIKEFENIEEIELHVVSPYPYLKNSVQEFTEKGIYYHFFKSEDDTFRVFVSKHLFHRFCYYKNNSRIISGIINSINPEIIHLFGLENHQYSSGILENYNNIITIAQLQTLINDPDFKNNYPISEKYYNYRSLREREIINKVDYIGTCALKYRNIISKNIRPSVVFLSTGLCLKNDIVTGQGERHFDFVYFAANINKAVDLAIEAFAMAYMQCPGITLDIIGGYEAEFKQNLDTLIEKYGIAGAVTFEGRLPSHDDVLKHIRKSRFALLPLKIDLTSGTIREAMANGLPVVTTDTGELGTQMLNLKRKSVLISPVGDHQALADNMISLLENEELAETLRQNSFETSSESRSNTVEARWYVEAYKACIESKKNNKPLPAKLTDI